ncbi:hypothetical protein [Streptomyces sp. NA04227]|uniref:hypothetical protein n=1 Tax=Streptomyces sp. NA04227 TaxID=2742136 RepID=UPI0020CA49E8|nr:hypothetical protein [Streptomyces sp. NA04227]
MLEPRPVVLRIAPIKIGPALTEGDNRAPAPLRGNQRPARALSAPARRVPPSARNLPRRSGY